MPARNRHLKVVEPPVFECANCLEIFPRRYNPANQSYDYKTRCCSPKCGHEFRRRKFVDKHGYVITHWNRDGRRVYITEHREAMEQHLGRKLTRHETVHHKNGDRADNRIENLELWSSRHGKGQRVEDKIEHARALLAEYGIDAPVTSISDAVRGCAGLI